MNILESILLAIESVKANKLRASLTLLSIAIGVFAIMGAGTLVSSINSAVTTEIANLGENTFAITKMPAIHADGKSWRKYMHRKPITYSNSKELRKMMTLTDDISVVSASSSNTIKSGGLTTDPDVTLIGADDKYFTNNNLNISEGRIFYSEDLTLNHSVAIVGNDVIVKLFPNISPIGKNIYIKNHSFTIIGVLASKGAILGQSQDNRVVIPITKFLGSYANEWEESLTLTIKAADKSMLNATMDEAIGNLRTVRNVKPWEENDFEVETNESISAQFAPFTNFLSYFGLFSGIISLVAAGVGITNIMLISVKERTREIGVRKAVGAKRIWILTQFIIEAITLCQIGGFIGIVVGMTGAWLLGLLIHINLVFPIQWIILSLFICTLLGIVSGAYPARKAARLDPIDALRYE